MAIPLRMLANELRLRYLRIATVRSALHRRLHIGTSAAAVHIADCTSTHSAAAR